MQLRAHFVIKNNFYLKKKLIIDSHRLVSSVVRAAVASLSYGKSNCWFTYIVGTTFLK